VIWETTFPFPQESFTKEKSIPSNAFFFGKAFLTEELALASDEFKERFINLMCSHTAPII